MARFEDVRRVIELQIFDVVAYELKRVLAQGPSQLRRQGAKVLHCGQALLT